MIENALTERFKELISAKSASVLDFRRMATPWKRRNAYSLIAK